MKVEITDPELGTRTFDANDHTALIADQLKLLQAFQKKGNKTQELKDDIRFYEFILASDNPSAKADEYLESKARFRESGIALQYNHEVGDLLGWVWRLQ